MRDLQVPRPFIFQGDTFIRPYREDKGCDWHRYLKAPLRSIIFKEAGFVCLYMKGERADKGKKGGTYQVFNPKLYKGRRVSG